MKAESRRMTVTLRAEGNMVAIPVTFDPKAAFGKARAPVRVTVNGYTYRSTISIYSGEAWIPLRKSHREAAGVRGNETLEVLIEMDTEERTVQPPGDLAAALRASPPAWDRWTELSYTHQREWAEAVEGAKKPETRVRRIAKAVAEIGARKKR